MKSEKEIREALEGHQWMFEKLTKRYKEGLMTEEVYQMATEEHNTTCSILNWVLGEDDAIESSPSLNEKDTSHVADEASIESIPEPDVVDDLLEDFKALIESGNYSDERVMSFLDEEDLLDDDFTRSEVSQLQKSFMDLAEAYLKEHYPGQFILYRNWAVHICTVEFQRQHLDGFKHYRQC